MRAVSVGEAGALTVADPGPSGREYLGTRCCPHALLHRDLGCHRLSQLGHVVGAGVQGGRGLLGCCGELLYGGGRPGAAGDSDPVEAHHLSGESTLERRPPVQHGLGRMIRSPWRTRHLLSQPVAHRAL